MKLHTLLLRLTGPMQSWGSDSQFIIRETHLDPTKSGVVGLCCAALGWERSLDLSPFIPLRMGVRIDKPGKIEKDFQTAENVLKATGIGKRNVISERFYLADANFLVGFEGNNIEFLSKVHNALAHPKFNIYLGRKSYVPSKPVYIPDGLLENMSLLDSFKKYPIKNQTQDSHIIINCSLEVDLIEADQIRYDQIMKKSFITRKYEQRGIKYIQIDINN